MAVDSSRSKQLKRQLDAAQHGIDRLRAELECAKEEKWKLSECLQEEEDEVYLLQASLKNMKAKYQAELRYQGQLIELVESNGVQLMMERDEIEKRNKALEEEVRDKHFFLSLLAETEESKWDKTTDSTCIRLQWKLPTFLVSGGGICIGCGALICSPLWTIPVIATPEDWLLVWTRRLGIYGATMAQQNQWPRFECLWLLWNQVTPLPSNGANNEFMWLTHCDNCYCTIHGIWERRVEPEDYFPDCLGPIVWTLN